MNKMYSIYKLFAPIIWGWLIGSIIAYMLDKTGNVSLIYSVLAMGVILMVRLVVCHIVVMKTLDIIFYLDIKKNKEGSPDFYFNRYIARKLSLPIMALQISKWTVESFYGEVFVGKDIEKD